MADIITEKMYMYSGSNTDDICNVYTNVVSFRLTYLSVCDMAQPSAPTTTSQQEHQPKKTTTCHNEDPFKIDRSLSGLNLKVQNTSGIAPVLKHLDVDEETFTCLMRLTQ